MNKKFLNDLFLGFFIGFFIITIFFNIGFFLIEQHFKNTKTISSNYHNFSKDKNYYDKIGYDFYFSQLSNNLKNNSNIKYLAFNYDSLYFLDDNFSTINIAKFSNLNYYLPLWNVKIKNNILWFGFERFKLNIAPINSTFLSPINSIMLVNLSNLNNYSLIYLDKLKHPNSFCFDENFTYFTSFENGFKFGVGKVNNKNLSDVKERIYKNFSQVCCPKIFLYDNNIFIFTKHRIFKLNKESLDLEIFLENLNINYHKFELNGDILYLQGYDNILEKENFYLYDMKNKKYLKSFFPNFYFLYSFVLDKEENLIYLSDFKKNLYKYSLNGTFLKKIPKIEASQMFLIDDFITTDFGYFNKRNKKIVYNQNHNFYNLKNLIKINNSN